MTVDELLALYERTSRIYAATMRVLYPPPVIIATDHTTPINGANQP